MRQERKTIGNAAAETKGRHARWRQAALGGRDPIVPKIHGGRSEGARREGPYTRVHTISRGQPRAILIGVRE